MSRLLQAVRERPKKESLRIGDDFRAALGGWVGLARQEDRDWLRG